MTGADTTLMMVSSASQDAVDYSGVLDQTHQGATVHAPDADARYVLLQDGRASFALPAPRVSEVRQDDRE